MSLVKSDQQVAINVARLLRIWVFKALSNSSSIV